MGKISEKRQAWEQFCTTGDIGAYLVYRALTETEQMRVFQGPDHTRATE